jgi:hypothetical protein
MDPHRFRYERAHIKLAKKWNSVATINVLDYVTRIVGSVGPMIHDDIVLTTTTKFLNRQQISIYQGLFCPLLELQLQTGL